MDTLKLNGLEVVKSFYSTQEPNITHAQFEVANSGGDVVSLTVQKVKCCSNGYLINVPEFFLYSLPEYLEHENKLIQQAPMTTAQYEVSFAPVSAAKFSQNRILVEIEFSVGGETIILDCPYVLDLRSEKC